MNERGPSSIEIYPFESEVVALIEQFSKGKTITEIKRVENQWGLGRLVFEGIDDEGDHVWYDYLRRSNFEAVIDVIFHNNEGIPCGGKIIMSYVKGQWITQESEQ